MILNDNSTQQINTLVIQLQNRITNLNNELKSLNKEISDLDSEISDLERKVSSNTNDQENDIAAMNAKIKANTEAISGKADKNHTHIKSQITDFDHNHDDRYYTESEVDAKLSGKADKSHTHTKSEITDFPTSLPANGGTADYANKIEPNYAKRVDLTTVTSNTIKYIKVADCTWDQTGTLQVLLEGNAFQDTLVINFGGGHATHPMLCGYCISHRYYVTSVIAQKGSNYNSSYSIYVKIEQLTYCTVKVALLKGDCTINITESTTAPTNISEWAVSDGFFGTLTGNASTAGTADKAVEVVDYGNTSSIVKIGYNGPGVTADKLLHLAGYTELEGPSVKLKDVSKEEIIKWLGIPRIKYADYRPGELTFSSIADQKNIELSNFGPDVTEDNVLSFMVIWWTGVIITASGDWAKSQGTGSSGLKCVLHASQAGTGQCVIRCVYMV